MSPKSPITASSAPRPVPPRPWPALLGSLGLCLVAFAVPPVASANPEPTAYDSRSVALGLSGVSYLERPAAVAINPALLEGIETFSASFLLNPFFVRQEAPVQGPESNVRSPLGVGPLGSFFVAGRIAPRLVFGVGVYAEVGFAAGFNDVVNVDGAMQNTQGEDLNVDFFVAEGAIATSVRVSSKVNLGFALRLPYARQKADLFANISPALVSPEADGSYDYTTVRDPSYQNVGFKVTGIGIPSGRVGISYKPNRHLSLGASYRMPTKIEMKGHADVTFGSRLRVPASADWRVPHALQFGGALHLYDDRLLLVLEERMQFHNAPRTGNHSEIVETEISVAGITNPSIFIPFDWRNVYTTRVAVEYSISELLDFRIGTGLGVSATTDKFAIYFTPPPGLNWGVASGLGFNFDHFNLDLTGAVAGGGGRIGSDAAAGGPVTYQNRTFGVCSDQQVIRSGCAGDYKVVTYWASLTLTYRL